MRASSSLLASSGMAIGVTAIAIAVMLLASNFTLINAQPQQVTSQPGEIENRRTAAGTATTAAGRIFQSTNDSFSVQVPDGWIIQDVDNAGPAQLEEVRQGYGILAQVCPGEQQGAAAAASNASGSSSTNTISSINASRCQGAQEVIHIIRYPDLDTRLSANNVSTTNNNLTTTIDNILTYHLQKLQEVGYRGMQIVNSTDMTSNLRDPQTNQTIQTVPGKLVEMTYSTNFAPNEIKRGYFILTATNSTVPNLGMTKGYGVFYEGNSTTTTTPAEITTAAASLPLPPQVGQVFDSFELIAAPGVAQALAEATEDDDDDDDNGADDDDDNGADDDDDNGADDDDDNGADDDDDNGADDDDDNGADDDDDDGNGEDGNGEDDLEDCTVSPGRDPGDDCDFTPDDADAAPGVAQALAEATEDDDDDDGNGEDGNGEDDLEDCTVSPGRDPGDDCDFTPDDADADA